MSQRRSRMSSAPAGVGAETSEVSRGETERGGAEAPAGARRGRPGRRTTEERTRAVVALLSGKASVDRLAAQYGVQASTVEGWRQLALEGIEGVLRQGAAPKVR